MLIEEARSGARPSTAALPRLGYLEFCESHRGPLGTGNVDIAAIAGAARGYTGPVGFEAFSAALLDPGARRASLRLAHHLHRCRRRRARRAAPHPRRPGRILTMRGPAVMLSQFMGDAAPFDSLDGVVGWLAGHGYVGVQVPIHDPPPDRHRARGDATTRYCRDYRARLAALGVEITELAAHRAGQLSAVNPAFAELNDAFAPPALRGDPAARQAWATRQLHASRRGRGAARPAARRDLLRRLRLALLLSVAAGAARADRRGLRGTRAALAPDPRPCRRARRRLCFELHPGEDLHDGVTFDRFLSLVDGHRRARILYDPSHMLLQHMDYLGFIDLYADRIAAFHVKDAEFSAPRPQRRLWRLPGLGAAAGALPLASATGRWISGGVFSRLAAAGYDGWACWNGSAA